MRRVLFDGIRAYPAFIVLGVICGLAVALVLARRSGIPLRRFLGLQLFLLFGALLGAKLYAVVERGALAPLSFELTHDFRYPGGIAFFFLFLLAATRLRPALDWRHIGDIDAVAASVAIGVARLGCFLNGCCFGVPTDLPIGVRFPSGSPAWAAHIAEQATSPAATSSLAVHPLQLYMAVVSFAIGWLLIRLWSRRAFPGQILLLFFVLHNGSKGLLEGLRHTQAPHLQTFSLAVALVATVILIACSVSSQRRVKLGLPDTA